MTATDAEHRKLCHALLDAIERGDTAGVEACYAPEMTMWFNVTGAVSSRDENLAALATGEDLLRRRTYNDRIVNTFEDGFVIQYTLNGVMHTGHRGALWICIVARCRDGRITRIDEYMDSSKFGAWMGPRRRDDVGPGTGGVT